MFSLFTSIHVKLILSGRYKIFSKILLLIRNIILKFFDPEIRLKIHNHKLFIKFSHRLPIYIAGNVLYDTALSRIVKHIKSKSVSVSVIDVGANIGDTVALLKSGIPNIKIICIEGSTEFLYFLYKNFDDDNNVNIEGIFLTDTQTTDKPLELISQKGTASLNKTGEEQLENITNITTLDNLLNKKNYHNKIDLIKVDTDGFDYKVIRGAKETIKLNKPLIYFELVSSLLRDNNEKVMSIFDFLANMSYTNLIIYDNLGYPIGHFNINDKSIKMIIDYIDIKCMYLDVLVSTQEMDKFYIDELNAVNKLLN